MSLSAIAAAIVAGLGGWLLFFLRASGGTSKGLEQKVANLEIQQKEYEVQGEAKSMSDSDLDSHILDLLKHSSSGGDDPSTPPKAG